MFPLFSHWTTEESDDPDDDPYIVRLYKRVYRDLLTARGIKKLPTFRVERDPGRFLGPALANFNKWLETEFPSQHPLDKALNDTWSDAKASAFTDEEWRPYKQHEFTLALWAHLHEHREQIQSSLDLAVFSLTTQFYPAQLAAADGPSPWRVPLYQLLPDPAKAVEHVHDTFGRGTFSYDQKRLFVSSFVALHDLARSVTMAHHRLCARRKSDPERTYPGDFDLPARDLIREYFSGTPLLDFFMTEVPVPWENKDRFRHTHIIGGTGAGKTTLLKHLITHDIWFGRDRPSMVIVDPHSVLASWLTQMKLPNDRRLILIDPRDIEHTPAINPFAIQGVSEFDRERATNDALETLEYVMGALDLEMTGKQATLFTYAVRFLLTFPQTMGRNATLRDLRDLLKNAEPYRAAIEKLPDTQRNFLTQELLEVKTSRFGDTRGEIARRIDGILANPTLERLLCAPETKVDFFAELNRGSTIVIDTAEDFLGESSKLFGRMCIALVMQALKRRFPIPEEKRYPTYLIVDEAHNYFSDRMEKALTDLRKLRCGCIFAHHYLGQCTESLRGALMANTAIKFAADVQNDAKPMADAMRTTPAFIHALPKYTFAAYINGVTPHAVGFPVREFREIKKTPTEMAEFLERNRRLVSGTPRPTPAAASSPQDEDGDLSPSWE